MKRDTLGGVPRSFGVWHSVLGGLEVKRLLGAAGLDRFCVPAPETLVSRISGQLQKEEPADPDTRQRGKEA